MTPTQHSVLPRRNKSPLINQSYRKWSFLISGWNTACAAFWNNHDLLARLLAYRHYSTATTIALYLQRCGPDLRILTRSLEKRSDSPQSRTFSKGGRLHYFNGPRDCSLNAVSICFYETTHDIAQILPRTSKVAVDIAWRTLGSSLTRCLCCLSLGYHRSS